MKKILSLILVVLLGTLLLAGCTQNKQDLWDAYVNTSDINSANIDMSLGIKVDTSDVSSNNVKQVLSMINNAALDLNAKTIMDKDNGKIKMVANGNLTAMNQPYNFDFAVNMDFSDTENPEFIEIFKLPENIPNMPTYMSSKYLYIDIADMPKTDVPQINTDGFKQLFDTNQILGMLENIDTSNLDVEKNVVGENKEYTISLDGDVAKDLTGQYFSAFYNSPLFEKMYTTDTLKQSKQALDMMAQVFEQINLFGEKGINAVITVSPDGFIIDENLTIDLNINIAEFAKQVAMINGVSEDTELGVPDETIKATINLVAKYSDINQITSVEMPELTGQNSIDINSFANINTSGPSVLLNGSYLNFEDVWPTLVNDRTMVPMRKIFESLGATVGYDNGLITATKGDIVIKHTIGEDVLYLNDEPIQMDVKSFETEGRTLVPIRFVSKALGAQVAWEENINSVIITMSE